MITILEALYRLAAMARGRGELSNEGRSLIGEIAVFFITVVVPVIALAARIRFDPDNVLVGKAIATFDFEAGIAGALMRFGQMLVDLLR